MTDDFGLEDRLNQVAQSTTVAGDLGEVLETARRNRVRRRTGLGVGVAALVALAGFGGYRAGLGSNRSVTGSATPSGSSPPSTIVAPSTTWPATTLPATTGSAVSASSAPAATVPVTTWTEDKSAGGGDVSVGTEFSTEGGSHSLMSVIWPAGRTQPVLDRTVGDLRLQVAVGGSTEGEVPGYEENGWSMPKWCFGTGGIQVTVNGGSWVDVLTGQWFPAQKDGIGLSGGIAGNPTAGARVGVAQVSDPSVTAIEVRYGDGGVDTAPVENGYAVWAVPGYGERVPRFTFIGGQHPSIDLETWAAEFDKSCQPPPPALPAPGEQPADRVAAEAAVRDVAGRAFDGISDLENEYDDTTGLQQAIDEVGKGGYSSALGATSIEIDEVVFTSPTEAWFRYDLHTVSTIRNRFGRAVLIDGTWKLTRQTLCQDLALAGVQCRPSAGGTIQPPG